MVMKQVENNSNNNDKRTKVDMSRSGKNSTNRLMSASDIFHLPGLSFCEALLGKSCLMCTIFYLLNKTINYL